MRVFAFTGWSGSGKTTLIEALAAYWSTRGVRVACAKQAHHGYALQPEGKDTARMLAAGAGTALLLAGGEMLTMRRVGEAEDRFAAVIEAAGAAQVLLLEGLAPAGVPLVEVLHPDNPAMRSAPERLAAVAGRRDPGGLSVPFLPIDDAAAVAHFLEAYPCPPHSA